MSYMKFPHYGLLLMGLLMASINKQPCQKSCCTHQTTKTGLMYKTIQKGNGKRPQEGMVMVLNMSYETPQGEVLLSTEDQKKPIAIPYEKEVLKENNNITEAIKLLTEGGKIVCKVKGADTFGENWQYIIEKHSLKANDELLFKIHLQAIMTKEQHQEWERKQILMLQKRLHEEAIQQLQEDKKIIKEYLDKNQLTAQTTASGLHYIIETPGSGIYPQPIDSVKVHYTGKLLNGQVFDTSVEASAKKHGLYHPLRRYEPIEFLIGAGHVIKGWDEGIGLLKKGGKAKLIIPSTIAYGKQGAGASIPANAILIFDVELVDIKKISKPA